MYTEIIQTCECKCDMNCIKHSMTDRIQMFGKQKLGEEDWLTKQNPEDCTLSGG